jgi:hypothetical protein
MSDEWVSDLFFSDLCLFCTSAPHSHFPLLPPPFPHQGSSLLDEGSTPAAEAQLSCNAFSPLLVGVCAGICRCFLYFLSPGVGSSLRARAEADCRVLVWPPFAAESTRIIRIIHLCALQWHRISLSQLSARLCLLHAM